MHTHTRGHPLRAAKLKAQQCSALPPRLARFHGRLKCLAIATVCQRPNVSRAPSCARMRPARAPSATPCAATTRGRMCAAQCSGDSTPCAAILTNGRPQWLSKSQRPSAAAFSAGTIAATYKARRTCWQYLMYATRHHTCATGFLRASWQWFALRWPSASGRAI